MPRSFHIRTKKLTKIGNVYNIPEILPDNSVIPGNFLPGIFDVADSREFPVALVSICLSVCLSVCPCVLVYGPRKGAQALRKLFLFLLLSDFRKFPKALSTDHS